MKGPHARGWTWPAAIVRTFLYVLAFGAWIVAAAAYVVGIVGAAAYAVLLYVRAVAGRL